MQEIIQAYVPFPSAESAELVSKQIILDKLAICSNIISGKSIYVWESMLHEEAETIVFFKTTTELKSKLIEAIETLHPYEVPCIIIKKVETNTSYYNWMSSILD